MRYSETQYIVGKTKNISEGCRIKKLSRDNLLPRVMRTERFPTTKFQILHTHFSVLMRERKLFILYHDKKCVCVCAQKKTWLLLILFPLTHTVAGILLFLLLW